MFQLSPRPFQRLILWLAVCAFLTACGGASSSSRPEEVTIPAAVVAAVVSPSPIPTSAPTATATQTAPATPSATPGATPAARADFEQYERGPQSTPRTPQPTAAPKPTSFPCVPGNWRLDWEASGRLPPDVSMEMARFAYDAPRSFFIAVENWVGLIELAEPFDAAEARDILVVGFAEIPELTTITDIEVQGGTAFIGGDSQLRVLNTDNNCYLLPIATADFPFPVQDVELEGDRIYVGGIIGGQLHIEVLDRRALPNIERLGTLSFAPALWSVVGGQLLTYTEHEVMLTVADVTNLGAVVTRQTPLPIDLEWDVFKPQLVNDALSFVTPDAGLVSITGLLEPEPTMASREVPFYFAVDGHTAGEHHLFVRINFCDVDWCISEVYVATRDLPDELVAISLYPHYPVHHYYAIQESIVFAFSNYSLIVIDRTAPEGREIVRTYPLRW